LIFFGNFKPYLVRNPLSILHAWNR